MHSTTLDVVHANVPFLSIFATEDSLACALSKDHARVLIALTPRPEPAIIELTVRDTTYTLQASRAADSECIAVCLQPCEKKPDLPPFSMGLEVASPGIPLDRGMVRKAQGESSGPVITWDASWLADTSLQLRTNMTAITSMNQLLTSTPLSAEQSLYNTNLRWAAAPRRLAARAALARATQPPARRIHRLVAHFRSLHFRHVSLLHSIQPPPELLGLNNK